VISGGVIRMMEINRRSRRHKRGAAGAKPHRSKAFLEDWENFVDRVRTEIQAAHNGPNSKSPYYAQSSVIKREVYKFVLEHRGKIKPDLIEDAILHYCDTRERQKKLSEQRMLRFLRSDYKSRPFYWALFGLEGCVGLGNFTLKQYDISRYARQLEYADRHYVPPEFLIGFIFQVGTVAKICESAKDPNKLEDWESDWRARRSAQIVSERPLVHSTSKPPRPSQ